MTKPIEQMAVEYVLLLTSPINPRTKDFDTMMNLRNKMIDEHGPDQYSLHIQNAEEIIRMVSSK